MAQAKLQCRGINEVVIHSDTKICSFNAVTTNKFLRCDNCHVNWDRESDALITTTITRDRSVDSYHFTTEAQQRPATIARVNSCICLDEILNDHALLSKLEVPSSFGADYAVGNTMAKTKWGSNCDHEITNFKISAVTGSRRYKIIGLLNFNDC